MRAQLVDAVDPPAGYPEHLPVVDRRDDIAAAIRDHQVVVIAGETGSGKTTQLPKICLELGRGLDGSSATPSRAGSRPGPSPSGSPRSSPVELGTAVGYQVRFTDQQQHATRSR